MRGARKPRSGRRLCPGRIGGDRLDEEKRQALKKELLALLEDAEVRKAITQILTEEMHRELEGERRTLFEY